MAKWRQHNGVMKGNMVMAKAASKAAWRQQMAASLARGKRKKHQAAAAWRRKRWRASKQKQRNINEIGARRNGVMA